MWKKPKKKHRERAKKKGERTNTKNKEKRTKTKNKDKEHEATKNLTQILFTQRISCLAVLIYIQCTPQRATKSLRLFHWLNCSPVGKAKQFFHKGRTPSN